MIVVNKYIIRRNVPLFILKEKKYVVIQSPNIITSFDEIFGFAVVSLKLITDIGCLLL